MFRSRSGREPAALPALGPPVDRRRNRAPGPRPAPAIQVLKDHQRTQSAAEGRQVVKIIECKQYTPEWWEARRGIPTASNFDKILTPKTEKASAQQADYLA